MRSAMAFLEVFALWGVIISGLAQTVLHFAGNALMRDHVQDLFWTFGVLLVVTMRSRLTP